MLHLPHTKARQIREMLASLREDVETALAANPADTAAVEICEITLDELHEAAKVMRSIERRLAKHQGAQPQ